MLLLGLLAGSLQAAHAGCTAGLGPVSSADFVAVTLISNSLSDPGESNNSYKCIFIEGLLKSLPSRIAQVASPPLRTALETDILAKVQSAFDWHEGGSSTYTPSTGCEDTLRRFRKPAADRILNAMGGNARAMFSKGIYNPVSTSPSAEWETNEQMPALKRILAEALSCSRLLAAQSKPVAVPAGPSQALLDYNAQRDRLATLKIAAERCDVLNRSSGFTVIDQQSLSVNQIFATKGWPVMSVPEWSQCVANYHGVAALSARRLKELDSQISGLGQPPASSAARAVAD